MATHQAVAGAINHMQQDNAPTIALVAGEISGDWLGAGLIKALRKHYPDAHFEGVTGPRMRAAGCQTLADIEQLSLFGVAQVVRKLPQVLSLRRRLARRFQDNPPDVFVGIDAPDFNTALEKRLRRGAIPTVHYVCPTVWAWRKGRVRGIRKAVDLLLSIFPFEPAWFENANVPVKYVGHRLADEMPLQPDRAAARTALGLPRNAQIVGLLPGSRGSEVEFLGPRFIATAQWLQNKLPDLHFVAPMATPKVRALFAAQLQALAPTLSVSLIDGQAREVMTACDALLMSSGTATLEALLAKTPMVVCYGFAPVNAALARVLGVNRIVHFGMPNLIAGRELVPELRQQQVRPDIAGPWLYRLLTSDVARSQRISVFRAIHERLACDADACAAEAIAGLIETAH